jgi:preprotein translocase subunit SecG
MFLVYIVALLLFYHQQVTNAKACAYTASGNTITLDPIKNKGIINFLGDNGYYFNLTACDNGCSGCSSAGGDVMATQSQKNVAAPGSCQNYIGKYDDSVQPTYSTNNGGSFTFTYTNGQSASGCGAQGNRWLILKFICGSTDVDQAGMTVTEPATCQYEMTVPTRCACSNNPCSGSSGGGGSSSSSSDGGLSGGWVFIIILIVILFLYCSIGYILMGRKNEKGFGDVKNNIPNAQFWTLLPKYVMAGCAVSKDYCMALVNKGRGGGGNTDNAGTTTSNE